MSCFALVAACGALLVAACGGEAGNETPDAGAPVIGAVSCEADDAAFVRKATLGLLGRRPLSQDEVNVWVEIMAGIRGENPALEGPEPRALVARALAERPEYVDRWSELLMDKMMVQRINDQSQGGCYGGTNRNDDGGALAAYVRDHAASEDGDGGSSFTMRDLVRSSMALDDVTPALRGHLFAMLNRPIPAANVPEIQAELARRDDFGLMFDTAYLNRDLVCLGCHNSEGSVTFDPDPALNRHWALPGLVEAALYGQSNGIDPNRAHAVFRYDSFVAEPFGGFGGERPWGWDGDCGEFHPQDLGADLAGVDGKFGNLTGDRTTVYDLEAMLMRGVDKLAEGGLAYDVEGTVTDPDAAFAYLVAMSMVEWAWRELVGTPLTIANYFPRTEVARDTLHRLTTRFVASHFSLKGLLVDIVTSPYFNPVAPAAGCGDAAYALPNIYDPWVISDDDPARRLNGAGDQVHPLSARTLLSAAHAALGWEQGPFASFPELTEETYYCLQAGLSCAQLENVCATDGDCCDAVDVCYDPSMDPGAEQAFQRGVGVFLKNGERGFRGLDFQARLVWEERFGACTPGDGATTDFIDELLARATTASLRDVVVALKDRVIGEPWISREVGASGTSESDAIEALFGATLDTPAAEVAGLETGARRMCGVLVASPQFMLEGLPPQGVAPAPALTPDALRFAAVCADVAARGVPEARISCGDGTVQVDVERWPAWP